MALRVTGSLAHGGGERELLGFDGVDEAQVKAAQCRVVPDRDKGRHGPSNHCRVSMKLRYHSLLVVALVLAPAGMRADDWPAPQAGTRGQGSTPLWRAVGDRVLQGIEPYHDA